MCDCFFFACAENFRIWAFVRVWIEELSFWKISFARDVIAGTSRGVNYMMFAWALHQKTAASNEEEEMF